MAVDMLLDIKERLDKKNIHEVRQIARAIGVSSPTFGKKERIIDDILSIASCETEPAARTTRGAPPKSSDYDEILVGDIKECIKHHNLLKEGTQDANDSYEVSDGTTNEICGGILVKAEKLFYLRVNGCLPGADDVYVHESFINRFHLREGDFVKGECRRKSPDKFAGLTKILSVNGYSPDSVLRRDFAKLTPVYPNKRIQVAKSGKDIAARMIDMFAPVGYGQRAVISAPANSGNISLIKQIIAGMSMSEQELALVIFIVAGSPEEVIDIERTSCGAQIFYTTFDMETEQHVQAAEFVATYCKNAVELGENIVLIVDGLSKLGGAAKRILFSAICAEEGGSLTVVATVSAEGEYSSEYSAELISVANMCAILPDSDNRTPTIDIAKSYTRNCELLQSEQEIKTADILRKRYKTTGNIDDIIDLFKNSENNTGIIKSNG